mmetsp:Transcript_33407/g.65819  ORF Transcript_33407/g.65819 Transcript_33407/m.65819 type:complete len:158 (-) Transcript_33407:1845-2318(-)
MPPLFGTRQVTHAVAPEWQAWMALTTLQACSRAHSQLLPPLGYKLPVDRCLTPTASESPSWLMWLIWPLPWPVPGWTLCRVGQIIQLAQLSGLQGECRADLAAQSAVNLAALDSHRLLKANVIDHSKREGGGMTSGGAALLERPFSLFRDRSFLANQ